MKVARQVAYPETRELDVGDLETFEPALPEETSLPYGWDLAEVTQPDTGDCRSEAWLYNDRQKNPQHRMSRTW